MRYHEVKVRNCIPWDLWAHVCRSLLWIAWDTECQIRADVAARAVDSAVGESADPGSGKTIPPLSTGVSQHSQRSSGVRLRPTVNTPLREDIGETSATPNRLCETYNALRGARDIGNLGEYVFGGQMIRLTLAGGGRVRAPYHGTRRPITARVSQVG